jgi:hypothetical protein
MRISAFALSCGLLALTCVVPEAARANDQFCLQPYSATITCQAGSCRGTIRSYVSYLPYQQVLTEANYGLTQYCCGAQIPVDSLWICPGPQPAKLERGELDQLAQTFGYGRVFVRTCRGGYQSLASLHVTQGDGTPAM